MQPAAIAARVHFNGRPLDAPASQTVAGAPLLLAIGGRMLDHNGLHIIGPPPESLAQANILLIIDDFLDT